MKQSSINIFFILIISIICIFTVINFFTHGKTGETGPKGATGAKGGVQTVISNFGDYNYSSKTVDAGKQIFALFGLATTKLNDLFTYYPDGSINLSQIAMYRFTITGFISETTAKPIKSSNSWYFTTDNSEVSFSGINIEQENVGDVYKLPSKFSLNYNYSEVEVYTWSMIPCIIYVNNSSGIVSKPLYLTFTSSSAIPSDVTVFAEIL